MWRFAQDFEVWDLTQNTVLLLFTLESNVQKILSQGPWTFDKYLSRYVDLGGSEPHWISFQYECLPVFCYWYGLLDQDEKDCRLWVDSGEHLQKHEQPYGPWLRASLTNIQQAQIVHTKSPHSTGPPQPQRPTPSPIMRPSSQTPNISPPMSDPLSSSQTDAAITHTKSTVTAPTHKEILLNSTLFDTFISNLDHELSNPPTSNTPTPFPKLAHTPITDFHELSVCSIQPLVSSIKQTDTLPIDHTITSDPTHTLDLPKNPRNHYHSHVSF